MRKQFVPTFNSVVGVQEYCAALRALGGGPIKDPSVIFAVVEICIILVHLLRPFNLHFFALRKYGLNTSAS